MKAVIALLALASIATAVTAGSRTAEQINRDYDQRKDWAVAHPYGQSTKLSTRLEMLEKQRENALRNLFKKSEDKSKLGIANKKVKALTVAIGDLDNKFIAKVKKVNLVGYTAFISECNKYPNAEVREVGEFVECVISKNNYITYLEGKISSDQNETEGQK